jgi:hypothetical protein
MRSLADLQALAAERALTREELGEVGHIYEVSKIDRLDLDRKSKQLKQVEDDANSLLIDQFIKFKVPNAVGGGKKFVLGKPSQEPRVDDWEKFQAHIIATGDFSLLERRVGRAAVKERWENNITVPGVEAYPVYKLKITKEA